MSLDARPTVSLEDRTARAPVEAPAPADVAEASRLASLARYNILDTPPEAGFDDIVRIAAHVCATTVALVSFVSFDRQWFKARVGFDACDTPLDQSVCAHVVRERTLLVIPDLREDERTRDNPLVTAEPFIRFYAGAPLLAPDGAVLGALCVIDDKPRPAGLDGTQAETLVALARQVMTQLELRRLVEEHARQEAQLVTLNASLEQQVAERTADLDRAWRLSQDLQGVMEVSGPIVTVNDRWTALLGWSPGDLIGTEMRELIHPDDVAATLEAVSDIVQRPVVTPVEFRLRHKDGSYRWFSWTGAFQARKVFASGRDIQEVREQAAALAAAETALRQAQKMEAVGQLTGGLAHDFNNLLTAITGSLELLQTRIAQGRYETTDRYVQAASGAARRAASLTQRLLAFSRRQTLDPKPTDVNRLASGMEELIRRSVGPDVDLRFVPAEELWPTLIDPGQLENALLNLCINGRDAMAPGGGRLTIETANKHLDRHAATTHDLAPGDYVSLCVTDTGAGMSPEVVARAFDPFFTTKPLGEGTGLGLSMVYGFARQSGGQVRIYSELGHGTTLCLYLPRHYGDAERHVARDPTVQPAPAQDGETVLVIDDEPAVRMLVTEVLSGAGYTAIEAADGPAGLRVVESNVRIDLLVTDVGLPGGMNGRQVADAARTLRPDLKVLFITGYAENAVLGGGRLDPGMAVLTKPFALDDLARRVAALVSASERGESG